LQNQKGKHFQEIVESIVLTTGFSKIEIAANIGIAKETLTYWQRNGVPLVRWPYVKEILGELMFLRTESIYGIGNLKRDLKRRGA
jgi:hypothetical protein